MLEYQELLNKAQYRVVSADNGPMLVVAGAGTGKTRTIVYRLAWLVEHGVAPWNILLLTFTRKAAREMLERAAELLNGDLRGLSGGTFHSFAYRVLRRCKPAWLGEHPFTVLDGADQNEIVKHVKEASGIGKGERGFPKNQAVMGYLSKARNKEMRLGDVLSQEAPHLLGWGRELEQIADGYMSYKRENFLMDYDDLLFELEALMRDDPAVLERLRDEYRHILVDEYQDTNLVQARIVRLLAGGKDEDRSVMAVGDEAQSIYAFRGATVRNILDFPELFPGTRVVPLEENYRSVQAVLDVANTVMSHAEESYAKELAAVRTEERVVRAVYCRSDVEQARCVARHIADLLMDRKPSDIAVLFRVGFQSYQTEVELSALGIPYRKYGGLRYQEAAHVKDLLSYLHLLVNPDDGQAFQRVAGMHDRVGPKTAEKIFQSLHDEAKRRKLAKSYASVFEEIARLEELRRPGLTVPEILDEVMEIYRPHLEEQYPEDYPQRIRGLQELQALGAESRELDMFLADVQLDSLDKEEDEAETVTLSTIHSAKGLEWDTVIVLDLVQGRFPSRHAEFRRDAMEEERRLMYVACTRARNVLELFTYREGTSYGYGTDYFSTSDFLTEVEGLPVVTRCVGASSGRLSCQAAGGGRRKHAAPQGGGPASTDSEGTAERASAAQTAASARPSSEDASGQGAEAAASDAVYTDALSRLEDIRQGRIHECQHRIFGAGRIVRVEEPDKLVVDFPALGRKTILASYIFVK
ncbi:MAG: ATP-dependent helicase [Desulfovibrionaceae bacterium]|nr:ATP-dependent helicase [Desulfovibrionaceae bacterium]